MKQSFVQENIKTLLNEDNLKPFKYDEFLKEKVKDLLNFYNDESSSVCFIEGKSGSYKTELFKCSQDFLSDDVILFKFKCFEGSTLDDVFLAFFEDLKKYSQKKKIAFTKIETNSISQRINNYLNHINMPAIILIDSLDNIFNKKSETEKEEFLNFIMHLNAMKKFKLVLIGNNLSSIFEIKNPTLIVMEAYNSEQIQTCFDNLKIDYTPEDIFKFYKITRGNPNYLYITANIITTLGGTLESLLNEFEKKTSAYEDFVLQKLVTFIPETVKNSLYSLSLVNEGLTFEYLTDSKFFTKEQINYMVEKGVLANEYGHIYIKSYLRKFIQSHIRHIEKLKIHKFWMDFYNSQLPLKPNNRAILISRNTMRSQIEYHASFLTDQMPKETNQKDLSLMGYLNSNLTAWNIKNTNMDEKREKEKAQGFEKYALTKDELSLLGAPVDMRTTEEATESKIYRTFEQKEEVKEAKEKLSDVLILAQDLEDVHSFENAYSVYKKALELKEDSDYNQKLTFILTKLAECSKKLNKTTEATEYYNLLIELYSANNDIEKMNQTRLEIAQIYKETYKINQAKVIYENFVNKKSDASDSIKARAYIELAEIEDDLTNTEKAIEHYKKAFSLSESIENKDFYTKAYFKYGLILDDVNRTDAALDYYQKCIANAKEPCLYLSCAYTNIAQIIEEKGNTAKALEYYKFGLKTDLRQSNYEGVYYICLKIAGVYETINNKNVLNWLLKSLSAAKRTKEKIYIINAYNQLGKYYEKTGSIEKSVKAYESAQKVKDKEKETKNAN